MEMRMSNFHTQRLDPGRVRAEPLRDFEAGDLVPWVIEFRVVGTPYILRSPMGRTVVIGRADPVGGFTPELDLTDYEGQAKGVSRRHARITARDNRIMVEDLGSANGTFVNGVRLEGEKRLFHGDMLSLGQFDLQVHFIVKPSVDDATRIGVADLVPVPRVADGETLLIVEEHLDVARLLGFYARQSGFAVTAVTTLEDGIAEIDREVPQAIITELMFDAGDGVDLIHYVRHLPLGRHVPILAVTNTTAGFTTGQALQKGADLFLGKPLAMDELIDSLGQLARLIHKTA
jgi:pSer/pThr/pTyr-binding forkhead associated (FHA) protein